MQSDRGYNSPYFVTDPKRMVCAPSAVVQHLHTPDFEFS